MPTACLKEIEKKLLNLSVSENEAHLFWVAFEEWKCKGKPAEFASPSSDAACHFFLPPSPTTSRARMLAKSATGQTTYNRVYALSLGGTATSSETPLSPLCLPLIELLVRV